VAHHGKIDQLHAAVRRPDVPPGETRSGPATLTRILSLVILCVLSFAASTSPASAATTTRSTATASWSIRDGCLQTDISLSTQTNGGEPRTSFFVERLQSCDDPNSFQPVFTLEGSVVGGQLRVSPSFTARLVATVPVTCTAYESGACDQEPYNAEGLAVNLSWDTTGRVLRTRQDGMTCRYRYGTATGSLLLGGVDLISTGGATQPADVTETNVQRCVG